MKIWTPTPEQILALESGEAVTWWEADRKLEGASSASPTGRSQNSWTIETEHGDRLVWPPYAPGEVLAVAEPTRQGRPPSEPARMHVYEDGEPVRVKCDSAIGWSFVHIEQGVPPEAARLWVRVETVEPEEKMVPSPPPLRSMQTAMGWAITVQRCEKPEE